MIEYDKDAIVPPYITEYLRAKQCIMMNLCTRLKNMRKKDSVPNSRA